MESEQDPRTGLEAKLRLYKAFAMVPDKMPALVELYRAAPVDDFNELIVQQIAELFDCSREIAEAINDLQFRYLHPHYQRRIAQELEVIEVQLKEL